MNEVRNALTELASHMPIISTHEHHREDAFFPELTLTRIFQCSYVGWCTPPPGDNAGERSRWLERIRHNTYFIWLEKSLCRLYEEDRLTADNWDVLDRKIRDAHSRSGDHHIRILKEKAHYQHFVQDCYWDPGHDLGHTPFVKPAYRIDMWLEGFHPESTDHNRKNPRQYVGPLPTLNRYEDALRNELEKKKPFIAALKCASAYERSVQFQVVNKQDMQACFGKHPDEIKDHERKMFGDYMFRRICQWAGELDIPIQVHTGLAMLQHSSPLLLEAVIKENPNTRFVLFHGGFPWTMETAALAHHYDNVVVDINWLPLISTHAAEKALHVYLDVLRSSERIAWGGDCWTSEESYGASLALRHLLGKVLSERVHDGLLQQKDAEQMMEKIMNRNARNIYGL